MKIGYFGTPEHSAKLLKSLYDRGHEILFVVTNMDKPQGRDRKLSFSPVKMMANQFNIPVLQFPNLKDDLAFKEIIKSFRHFRHDKFIFSIFLY